MTSIAETILPIIGNVTGCPEEVAAIILMVSVAFMGILFWEDLLDFIFWLISFVKPN